MKTEVKIKINLGDREIELTELEARELQSELNRVFGSGYWTYPVTYPWTVPYPQVTWTTDTITTAPDHYTTTC